MTKNKPPYKVLSMPEIEALPWNGFNVVSTFSGAGGSCLGYRMAGFRVLWASEFVPAAREVYKLNHSNSILDAQDIRKVQPAEILEATGLKVGELDILDGSPPCASFSTAGKREKGWGQVKNYSDTKQRVDDLFFEYVRILEGLQPKVFVAENVSGLIKGSAKGYFKQILKELKGCGYKVRAKVLDAQWLGVPQMRQRLIFIGVRNDLGMQPVYPKPLDYRYSVADALPWITSQATKNGVCVESRAYRDKRGAFGNDGDITEQPAPTVLSDSVGTHWVVGGKATVDPDSVCQNSLTHGNMHTYNERSLASVTHPTEKRKFSIAELKRICAFPDDFKLTGSYAKQWERLGRAVPPVMMYHTAKTIESEVLCNLK